MKLVEHLIKSIDGGALDRAIETHLGHSCAVDEHPRMIRLLRRHAARMHGDRESLLISSPGRTELAGNHTDHNNGRVLAAACHLDTLAAVTPRDDGRIVIESAGYDNTISVDTSDRSPKDHEKGTPDALVRGVVATLAENGARIGGFDATVESRVLPGSGLSSSAAFEILVGYTLSRLYNDDSLSVLDLARAGQRAENVYFGKPCGLMDQLACAHGGAVGINFATTPPEIKALPADFAKNGLALLVVDTGGSHADLTDDYAGVPDEMKSVAAQLGARCLGDADENALHARLSDLRRTCGDRAVLRALHFFAENRRVEQMIVALTAGSIEQYVRLVGESGSSSAALLQNTYSIKAPAEQGINLAVALAWHFMAESGISGAARVHGGGFAGTIQVYVPTTHAPALAEVLTPVFGEESIQELRIRPSGPRALG